MAEGTTSWGDREGIKRPVVAYIDDAKLNLDMVALHLKKAGFTPHLIHVQGEEFDDVRDQIDDALALKPVAFISDYDMKTMTGHEVGTYLQGARPDMPRFLYSGEDFGLYSNGEQIRETFTKVFTKTDFREMVGDIKALAGRSSTEVPGP